MKINEIPGKIYLYETKINNIISYRGITPKSCDNDIEYIRTDAFIEKACEFIAENMTCDGYTLQTKTKFIKEFRNYMKG